MTETYTSAEERIDVKNKTFVPMLWIGLVSIIMFFAGLTSAYVIRQAQGDWLYFDIPFHFTLSTLLIAISSGTMGLGQWAAVRSRWSLVLGMVIITALLGVGFALVQVLGWLELHRLGVVFTGPQSNISGSFFIALVFAHVAHLIAGLFSLGVVSLKLMLKRYAAGNYAGFKTAAIYWHFLGLLWLYLYLFLSFIR